LIMKSQSENQDATMTLHSHKAPEAEAQP